jgi:L-threonylcarbamoyladenylate synthase
MKLIELDLEKQRYTQAVDEAGDLLKQGKAVIIPTETAYGLAVDAVNQEAVKRLFEIKQRPEDKPVSVFVRSVAELEKHAVINSDSVKKAIARLWPGPVTFVLKAKANSWPGIISADGKIAFRCSNHDFVNRLIHTCQNPLTATSANLSGKQASSLEQIKQSFSDSVELFIVDPLLKFGNLPSTVVDLADGSPKIKREGMTAKSAIMEIFEDES